MKKQTDRVQSPEGAVPSWEQLYILANHWKSDLEFYKEDLGFLHHLVEKYVIWITLSENLALVKSIESNQQGLKEQAEALLLRVSEHQKQLGQEVARKNRKASPSIMQEHEALEQALAMFVKQFRKNREETFKISEYIIDSESLAHIMEK